MAGTIAAISAVSSVATLDVAARSKSSSPTLAGIVVAHTPFEECKLTRIVAVVEAHLRAHTTRPYHSLAHRKLLTSEEVYLSRPCANENVRRAVASVKPA
ncbi:hypothetical protein EDC04DRAFT_2890236 [Pisolithus marmoratus]|nr:hypothetical protein EDC04DRAFT_2890236 [Pisolithus marmoratus]